MVLKFFKFQISISNFTGNDRFLKELKELIIDIRSKGLSYNIKFKPSDWQKREDNSILQKFNFDKKRLKQTDKYKPCKFFSIEDSMLKFYFSK